MIVTDLKYSLEKKLVKKLDTMMDRCIVEHPKRDALLINEGGEGEGKSNSSVAEAYYLKYKTGRPVYLFFRLESLIEFAKATEKKIIIWDEPSLDSLAQEHYKDINLQLTKLLMTARKKRHFIIINMTKFWKFSEYIVVDRSLGMIHMYSRKEIQAGRFVYVRKKHLEPLYLGYKSSKKRLYKKFASFYGTFPDIMEKHFNKMGINVVGIDGNVYRNSTYQIYEEEKDKAIFSIGEKSKGSKDKQELKLLKIKVGHLKFPIKNRGELANQLKIPIRTIENWCIPDLESSESATPLVLTTTKEEKYNSIGYIEKEDSIVVPNLVK